MSYVSFIEPFIEPILFNDEDSFDEGLSIENDSCTPFNCVSDFSLSDDDMESTEEIIENYRKCRENITRIYDGLVSHLGAKYVVMKLIGPATKHRTMNHNGREIELHHDTINVYPRFNNEHYITADPYITLDIDHTSSLLRVSKLRRGPEPEPYKTTCIEEIVYHFK